VISDAKNLTVNSKVDSSGHVRLRSQCYICADSFVRIWYQKKLLRVINQPWVRGTKLLKIIDQWQTCYIQASS